MTLGFPLGLQEVQDQFKRFRKTRTLKVPACVGDWLNVADRIDPVALDKSLSSEFTPEKFIEDVRIWNKDSPRDPHSGTGYLSHDAVRGPVQQAVEVSLFQPVAAFVIARDLVRELESDAFRRHPVLIEIKAPDTSEVPNSTSRRRKSSVG